MNTTSSLLAIAFYLIGSGLLYRDMRSGQRDYKLALILGLIGAFFHAMASYTGIVTPEGMNISLSKLSVLISWFVVSIAIVSKTIRPLLNILFAVFTLSTLLLLLDILYPGPPKLSPHPGGVMAHIVFSLLGYSILTIAAIQAITLAIQEYRLKHHNFRGLLKTLPPLETMEDLLFELVLIGFILLTLSIGTGAYFVEDLFAQHLVHKSVFSIMAWLCFGTLLIGRHRMGWRSRTAIRWTLAAFVLLALGFVGSKFVLEVVLNRQ